MKRRKFFKTIGATALAAIKPGLIWSADSEASSISASATPAAVPKEAAGLYRCAFVLDCNTLAVWQYASTKR
jgi:hypothetical protein